MTKETIERITVHIHIDQSNKYLDYFREAGYNIVESFVTSWVHGCLGKRPVSYKIIAEKNINSNVIDDNDDLFSEEE